MDKFTSCNLAKVPAGALVGPPELQGSQLGNDIKSAIVNAASGNSSFLSGAKGIMGNAGFVFADAATGLRAQNKSFVDFFTPTTIEALQGTADLQAAADQAEASSGGGSSGVSSGAAAGIGIGCAVAGALIAAAVAMFLNKKKAAYRPHMDEGTKVVPTSFNPSEGPAKTYI